MLYKIMSVVIARELKDVYLDIMSDKFIATVFFRSCIKHRDKYHIGIEAKYDKTYLRDYESIMQLCLNVNDIVLNVEKTIVPFEDKFFACYLTNVKNAYELPLFPFLDSMKTLLVIEFKVCKEGTLARIVHTEVDHNISLSRFTENIDRIVNNNVFQIDAFTGVYVNDIKSLKELKKMYEKDTSYDMTKDFLVNFLNMLINNRIKYAYMKKVCKYYINSSVDIRLI